MKTRNKVFIGSGIIFLIMLIGGYSFISSRAAWSDPGRGFHSRFHGKGFHSRFHSKDISEFILWKMDREVEELKLTEAQRLKYEALKGNIEAHFSKGTGDRHLLMERFHTEMSKENPDVKYLVESVKTKMNEMSNFVNENLDLLMEFYDSLDTEQQGAIIDAIKERMEYHRS